MERENNLKTKYVVNSFNEDDQDEYHNNIIVERYNENLKQKIEDFFEEIFFLKIKINLQCTKVTNTFVVFSDFYKNLKNYLKNNENVVISDKNILIYNKIESVDENEQTTKKFKTLISFVVYIPYKKDFSIENLKTFLENEKLKISKENTHHLLNFYEIHINNKKNNLYSLIDKKYRYSEIFGNTFQGEGHYTGVNTVWYRSWGCNFNCNGFGQESSDPTTWKFDYDDEEIKKITTVENLPVFKKGCDSSYSWSKKLFHLSKNEPTPIIVDKIENFLKNSFNPNGSFVHPKSLQSTHLAFTGGEPLLAQSAIVSILLELLYRNNLPNKITIETNGTQKLNEKFKKFIKNLYYYNKYFYQRKFELFWSISPKLSISGEKWEDAIKPEIVQEYFQLSNKGQLKFVVDGSEKVWNEVENAIELYRNKHILFEVWIMPVGSEKEDLEKKQAYIAEEALKRGYYFSARVHCWVFGNIVGK